MIGLGRDGEVVVVFGLGSTIVSGSFDPEKPTSIVVLHESDRGPLALGESYSSISNLNIRELADNGPVVCLHFNNVEGLDVLMSVLTKAREAMVLGRQKKGDG